MKHTIESMKETFRKATVFVAALLMVLAVGPRPMAYAVELQEDQGWWQRFVPADSSLTVRMDAPSTSMIKDDSITEYYKVSIFFENVAADAHYKVDTSALSHDGSGLVPFSSGVQQSDIVSANEVGYLDFATATSGHDFYLRNGDSVVISGIHRFTSYHLSVCAPEWIDVELESAHESIDKSDGWLTTVTRDLWLQETMQNNLIDVTVKYYIAS